MKRYKRILIEEREEIMKSVVAWKSFREIERELKRNKKGRKSNKDLKQAQYSAGKAQNK